VQVDDVREVLCLSVVKLCSGPVLRGQNRGFARFAHGFGKQVTQRGRLGRGDVRWTTENVGSGARGAAERKTMGEDGIHETTVLKRDKILLRLDLTSHDCLFVQVFFYG